MDEKDKIIAEQQRRIQQLEGLFRRALESISELERRLGLNSTNSGKPPSTDGLRKPPAKNGGRKGKKNSSGGQAGHKGTTLMQLKNPDHVVVHPVTACQLCQADLSNVEANRHITRQVFDIPEPCIEVTEHQAEVKICSCGCKTTAQFPEDVKAYTQYGPRIKSFVIYLSKGQLIPEDRLQEAMGDIFSLKISTATIVNIIVEFSKLTEPIQAAVLEKLKIANIKHVDETGFRINSKLHWLHVICNGLFTHYRPCEKRGDLLDGIQGGLLMHDHWKRYFKLTDTEHSLCNAHHLRELIAIETNEKQPWARKMADFLTVTNNIIQPCVERLSRLYDRLIKEGLDIYESMSPLTPSGRKRRPGHNLLLRFQKYKDCVLRFLIVRGSPFTNNQAERDIRMMKVQQKISGCFRTMEGAQDFCNIRGFLSTCRKQGINLLEGIQKVTKGQPPVFTSGSLA